ncbi:peptidylprolyl isomerase [Flavobacterium pallidum]|uniref:Periplasmic chaperone PpiD n=1 Tax=Flavobacterium pallidum TaxID=2172098 RepID=A0A2S1SGJ1_9FLAO|nr:SurA N-terminal domain-containing protein [Flavobacterium pallidum]AWI25457.1 peptidylprolyl isomerase [Flavobacterium pallidum]
MAVLSKIRQRSILLIAVIGFCLFAFIIGDLVQSNLFSRSANNIGSVNGHDLPMDEFKTKVENVTKSSQGATQSQAVNYVWEYEVNNTLLDAEFDKLGLEVGDDQIIDILKQNPQIGQNPMFLGATGVFDIAKFDAIASQGVEAKNFVTESKKDAAENAKKQIYNTLLRAGAYTTALEGKMKYKMEADKVSFDYVSVLFSTIKDSDVKVSDDEIIAYMRKDEKRYKSEENRELDYVIFEDKASKTDEDAIKAKMDALMAPRVEYVNGKNDTIPSFANATNVAEFVNSNSDTPYDSTYIAKKDLPAQFSEQLYNLPTGQVFGPYIYNNGYWLSKSMGREAGANVKASHILLSYKGAMRAAPTVTRSKEEAAAKANELLAEANAKPEMFFMLAMQNSDDSSKQQGGDLGYFSKGANNLTKKFADYIFANPIGKLGLVETEFGYHIIKVTDKQDGVRLATISKKIEPSAETVNTVYNKAVKFQMEAKDKSFDQVAKAAKLTINPSVKVRAMDENLGAIANQRQIVKWAFNKDTKVGAVERFEVTNTGHVIVRLKKVNEEGLLPLDEARPMIELKLKNQKKTALIKAKMKGGSLEAIAAANATKVQTVADRTLETASLEGVGLEQRVVATAMVTPANKLSAPIEGMSGVYVVKTTAYTKAPAIQSYKDYVAKLKVNNGNTMQRISASLKKDAEIEDNRSLFY